MQPGNKQIKTALQLAERKAMMASRQAAPAGFQLYRRGGSKYLFESHLLLEELESVWQKPLSLSLLFLSLFLYQGTLAYRLAHN